MMLRPGDKVRILRGMMMDMGELAEVVDNVTYRIRIVSRAENVFREIHEEDVELVERETPDSWPPVLDDTSDL